MDKALLPLQGRTFIECLVDQCRQVSCHVMISVANSQRHAFEDNFESLESFSEVTWVEDQHQAKGPLAGIEAGLRALEPVCRYGFVIGCDVQVVNLRVSALAQSLSAHKVELADLRQFDPKLVSFLNINHPQAYREFLTSQGYEVDTELMERLNSSASAKS